MMMPEIWKCITPPVCSFAGLPVCEQLNDMEADIAFIGIHYVSPYPQTLPATRAMEETAPDAIRHKSLYFKDHLEHYDFDFNDVLLAGRRVKMVDCGDVDRQPQSGVQKPECITAAIRAILSSGALPIVLGTDEGGFIQVARAYDVYKTVCVVHFDAHIDWREHRHGVREGYSSVMRRTSEMPWVQNMAQIGLRGIGSARKGPIVGINLFEVRPQLDITGLTALTAVQLIINFIGTLAHCGQIGITPEGG